MAPGPEILVGAGAETHGFVADEIVGRLCGLLLGLANGRNPPLVPGTGGTASSVDIKDCRSPDGY
jgi:hypothetical protein